MEYIIIVLLLINTVLVVVSIMKNINESNITERLGRFETNVTKEIGEFKNTFSRDLNEDFNKLNNNIENRLNRINDKVNERLDENFKKSNQTFTSILERLTKIDEAQKKIDNLSNDIVSLQGILTDKKSRGIFGEVNLKHILSNVFGERNDSIYKLQHQLSNGTIADSVLFAPEPLGTIAIDSKFPLENYQRMVNKELSEPERTAAEKLFKSDMKRHIDAIGDKYIIEGETTNQAILFLPAEAIFAEVNAYHPDLIDYSYKKKVWITSPTTLISTLTVVQMIIQNMEKDKYTTIIHEEINKLGSEFDRYRMRWNKLSRSIDTVTKDVKDINVTTDKITKRFDSINKVEIENKDEEKLEI